MKTLHNLLYCDGVLTSKVIRYLVCVGTSRRERQAAASIADVASKSPDLYFAINDADGASFMERLVDSLRPDGASLVWTMRTVRVDVLTMWRMVRDLPLALLNSSRFEVRC